MQTAIMATISASVSVMPWYIFVCIFFMQYRRVRAKTAVSIYIAALFLFLLFTYFYINIIEIRLEWQWMPSYFLLFALFTGFLFIGGCMTVRLYWGTLLHVLLFVLGMLVFVGAVTYEINQLFFLEAQWTYPVICLIIHMVLILMVKRQFTKRICSVFDKAENQQIRMICFVLICLNALLFSYHCLLFNHMCAVVVRFWVMLFIGSTGVLIYVLALRIVEDHIKHTGLQAILRDMENQLQLQIQHYKMLTDKIAHSNQVHHDLRHHLMVIATFVEERKYEGLTIYLEEYMESIQEGLEPPVCENHVVNAIAQHYLAIAKKAGAKLDVQISLPLNAGVADTDLCIVFGNILENAADSIRRQQVGSKFLRCRCETIGGKITLTIDNSTDEQAHLNVGIGQSSVQTVAEKYGGTARFECRHGVYQSSVLLITKGRYLL